MPQRNYPFVRWFASAWLVWNFLSPLKAVADDNRTALIGFAGRLTEPLIQSAQQGAEMAVEEANQQRLKSADPIRFQLLPQDDRGNPNIATHIAGYYIKSGVSGVVGHWSSDAALAVVGTYERAGIPQLNFTPTSSELTSRNYKSIFRTIGGSSDTGATQAEIAIDVLKGQRIVIIGNDSAYSKGLRDAFVRAMAARSKKVLQHSSVAVNTSDFNAVLKSAAEVDADVIVFSAYVAQADAFLKAVKRLNIKAKVLLSPGASNQDFSAQDNGNFYVLEPDILQDQCSQWKVFAQKFQAKYGRAPSTYSRHAYNATNVLIHAIRQADSTDAAQITLALHKTHYVGLSSDVAFDAAGNLINPTYTLYHADGAHWYSMGVFPAEKNNNVRCAKS